MNEPENETAAPDQTPRKTLAPAAQRALAEAEARRKDSPGNALPVAKEINGRGGKEPVRYGDWEIKGIAVDF
jgi:hypothetical protein